MPDLSVVVEPNAIALALPVYDVQGGAAVSATNPKTVKIIESTKATYGSASVQATPAATTTDIAVLKGSASKTVRVKRVVVSGVATTAGSMDCSLVKHTVANTGGTKDTAPGIAKFDSTDGAASAVVDLYTANPTIDATAIKLSNKILNFGVAGAAGTLTWDFATNNDKPPVLRGVAQELAVNLNGQTVPTGGKVSVAWEWEEE